MRTKLLIGLLLFVGYQTIAQEGQVTIQQDDNIAKLLAVYNKVNKKEAYYQIQVGFGTLKKAEYLKSQIDVDFPGWPSKIEFQEPTYRVKLGKFSNPLEAERRYQQVRKKYPNAMLLKPENSSW